jgi:hypothetical protein
MLIIQIALGVVLGVLILRYLPIILRGGLVLLLITAVVAATAIIWAFAAAHKEGAELALGTIIFVVFLGVIIQGTAKGLGRLFVRHRATFQTSPRWQRALRLIGLSKAWVFSNASDEQLISGAGDKLFMGLFYFAGAYFLSWAAELLLVVAVARSNLPIPLPSAVLISFAFVPAIALAIWIAMTPKVPAVPQ